MLSHFLIPAVVVVFRAALSISSSREANANGPISTAASVSVKIFSPVRMRMRGASHLLISSSIFLFISYFDFSYRCSRFILILPLFLNPLDHLFLPYLLNCRLIIYSLNYWFNYPSLRCRINPSIDFCVGQKCKKFTLDHCSNFKMIKWKMQTCNQTFLDTTT